MTVRRRWLAEIAVVAVAAVTLALWLTHAASRTERGATAGGPRDGIRVAPGTGWNARRQAAIAGRRIAGIVVDDAGAPVSGAIVRVASARLAALTIAAPSTTTGEGGTFDLGLQPAEVAIVTAELAGTTAAIALVDLTSPIANPPPERLRLVLHACTAAIHGTVYDMAEGTIAGATLALVDSGVPTGAVATSDANGAFDLCVPVGHATVLIAADGYAPLTAHLSVTGRTRRDFQVAPGAVVTGHVVRASDKAPVSGARVEVRAPDPTADDQPLVTMSAADGRFEIAGVRPGRRIVLATADHLATVEPTELRAEVGVTSDVTIELPVAWTVSGRVIMHGTRAPAAGVQVTMFNVSRRGFDRFKMLTARSQADGSFVVENVPDGSYRPLVDQVGQQDPITVEGGDVSGLVLEVEPTATVSGRTLAGGKTVDGVEVRIGDWTTISDGEGRYSVRGIDEGTHEIYAESQRIGAFTRGGQVTVAAGEAKTGVDISLDLAGSIEGVVVDQDDAPVASAFVSFSLQHGKDVGVATTADDGTFRAGALSGGGNYVYEVHLHDESSMVLPPFNGKRFPPVAVKDGNTHVTGIRIRIRYERLEITGRVVDAQGKPVVDASVRGIPLGAGLYQVPSTMTSANGSFSLRELSPGGYLLLATGAHAEGRLSDVVAGTHDVVIRAASHGGIDGTLTGFARAPTVTAISRGERFERHPATVTGSTFSIRDLPAGQYTVVARVGTEITRVGAEVTAAQISTVTIGPAEYGSITGTVVDGKTRAPIERMRCRARGAMDGEPDDTGHTSETIAYTNSAGQFEIDHVVVGEVGVMCSKRGAIAWASTTVPAGRSAHVDLVTDPERVEHSRVPDAGMTLDNQLSDVVVETVEPGGPAAKAGVQVGDILLRVNDEMIGRFMADAALMMIEDKPGMVTLVLERDDEQLTVKLNLAAP